MFCQREFMISLFLISKQWININKQNKSTWGLFTVQKQT